MGFLKDKIAASPFYQRHRYRLRRYNDMLSFLSAICLVLFLMGDQSENLQRRTVMMHDIRIAALITGFQTGIFSVDEGVLKAMAQVPRHRFVVDVYGARAYDNVALPMSLNPSSAGGQRHMIPEPFLTAMMIDLMNVNPSDKVLDVGIGPGYEAAVLSRLAAKVFVLQHVNPLDPQIVSDPLERKGYANVSTRIGDGVAGWSENGPYDAILVRQALPGPPPGLVRQLKTGGRLVMPVGDADDVQRLVVFVRTESGALARQPTLFLKTTPLFSGHEI